MELILSKEGNRIIPAKKDENFEGEVFARIADSMYAISNYGRVYSFKSNRLMKTWESAKGYSRIELYGNKKYYVHRLVYEYFSGRKIIPGFHVDHLDGNKKNNHISNLDQCHPNVNHKRAREMGLYDNAEEKKSKIKTDELENILRALSYTTVSNVSKIFNRSYDTILRIKNGQSYQKEISFIKKINDAA